MKVIFIIDLHIHTKYSDGEDDICALLSKLKELEITHFSITDHDNIDGNIALLKEEHVLDGLKFISGIEFSAVYNGINMHLLGYGFDINSTQMNDLIKKGKDLRSKKIVVMIDYLHEQHRIVLSEQDKENLCNIENVGKPHLAKVLIKMGYGNTVGEVLTKYIDDCDLSYLKINTVDAIDAIHSAGGFSVLAHPIEIMEEYNFIYKDIEVLSKELKGRNLDGIEVYHSKHTNIDIDAFRKIAEKNNLLISCGSDYHGSIKATVKLGQASKEDIDFNDISLIELTPHITR